MERTVMEHFPIFFDLKERPVLLVGGGDNAVRKVRLLRKAAPQITVVAPSLCDELQQLAVDGHLRHVARPFRDADAVGQALVFAATDLDDVDRAVAAAARAQGVPVNAVDKPALSDFITPAIVDRSPLVVAICSSGAAPIVVRNLREKIESLLHPSLGSLVRFAESFRAAVRATRQNSIMRRRFWEDFFAGSVAQNYLSGRTQQAHEQMLKLVNSPEPNLAGHVAIVGAGPGDPDLLTFRAMRFMQQADVVVYDRLVDPAILDYVRRDADRIYAGKAPGRHAMTQAQINQLLVDEAQAGRRVVRLKSGDPFIFGRGGRKLMFCVNRGLHLISSRGDSGNGLCGLCGGSSDASRSCVDGDLCHGPCGRWNCRGRLGAACPCASDAGLLYGGGQVSRYFRAFDGAGDGRANADCLH